MSFYPSYWERSILLKTFDFIVLGAGIIGKQIAIKIKEKYPNARIALVDKYPIPYGASTRNAGFACFGSVSEILDDLKYSSKTDVIQLADKRRRGIQQLVEEFGTDSIGYRSTGSYEIFDPNQSEDLHLALNNLDFINSELGTITGLKNIFEIKHNTKFNMNSLSTCIFNQFEGMLNSGMLNETISNKAHGLGIIPFYGYDVKSIERIDNGYDLLNENNMQLTCKQLIVANNAFASQLLPELDVVPARGQIIITKPIENLPFDGIFHSDKGYVYFRNIDQRVLIGGGRNHFREEETTYNFEGSLVVKDFLINYLKNVVLPNREFEIDMHWSGLMAMGKVKLPIVKRENENLLLCVRMSGMGVALGPILSDEIVAML
jgi:glycine/D-amino acid oxidase-like deaminating enzyme